MLKLTEATLGQRLFSTIYRFLCHEKKDHDTLLFEQKVSYAEIQSRFDYLTQNKYGAMVLLLAKDNRSYDNDLHRLVEIYRAIQIGPIEGLRRLAGEAVALPGPNPSKAYSLPVAHD